MAVADADGVFVLSDLKPGKYKLAVAGFRSAENRVSSFEIPTIWQDEVDIGAFHVVRD